MYPAAAGQWAPVSTAPSPERSGRCRHPEIFPLWTCRETVLPHVIRRTRTDGVFAASGAGSYRSLSSGSMQRTFWNRTVMNSSGSAQKTRHLENTHRLVIYFTVVLIKKPFGVHLYLFLLSGMCRSQAVCGNSSHFLQAQSPVCKI